MLKNSVQNQLPIKEQGSNICWGLVTLIHRSKQSAENFFKIYDQDQDCKITFNEFCNMIYTVQPNAEDKVLVYLFNLADFDKQGFIKIKDFILLMSAVDLKKDKPKYIIQQEMEKSYYRSAMNKLSFLKQQHKNNQINISQAMSSLEQIVGYKEFFDILEKLCKCKINDYEKVEITKMIDKDFSKKIDLSYFLQFMGIQNHFSVQPELQPIQLIPTISIKKNNLQQQSQQNNAELQNQNNSSNTQYRSLVSQQRPSSFKSTQIVSLDQFKQTLNVVMQSDNPFIDNDFPANDQSLQLEDPSHRKYIWLRPKQLFGGEYFIFEKMSGDIIQSRIGLAGGLGEYISPYDVIQGELGDCYFLSSLSSLAVDPERILNLFINPHVNSQGIYGVVMCHDGEWQAIWVDDLFPCHSNYSGPAFTKGNGNELWVLILEKAWAKLWGNYGKIEAGLCRDALRDLTGAPTRSIRTEIKDPNTKQYVRNEQLIIDIEQALNPSNQFLITCGTNDDEYGVSEQMGLIPGHAYSIIKLINIVNHPQRGNVQLLKMRNPWGKKEWNGDWSDESNLWTPQLKSQYNIKKREDGIFFIEVMDFYKYFNDVEICYYHKFYKYNSLRIESSKHNSQYITINVEKNGYYYITANQKSKRQYGKGTNYNYSPARVTLIKLGENQQFIQSIQQEDRECYIEGYLQADQTYLLMYKINWQYHNKFESVISSYGPGQTQFNVQKQTALFKNVLHEVMLQRVHKDPEMQKSLKPYTSHPEIIKGYQFNIKEGFGFVYVKNNGNSKVLDTKMTFQNMKGLKQRKPNRGDTCQIVCPPGEEFLSVFSVSSEGYEFKLTEEFIAKSI